jgi:hypothetical protein
MPRGFRYALIVSAMAFAWLAGNVGPGQAAPQTEAAASNAKPLALGKFTKHRKKHVRHHTRSSRKHQASAKADKSSKADKNADKSEEAKVVSDAKADMKAAAPLSPSVANARAELTNDGRERPISAQENATSGPSTLTEADKAVTTGISSGVQVTTSDQLNDMDRDAAAPAISPAPTTVALAQMPEPALASASNESGAWGSASLIGKIFIAFGLMLTLASAARMLIA